jgi:hypothetical protein
MAKIGPNGLPYVLPNKKALPFTPESYAPMTNSTTEGRMALRNSDFNSYMGDSGGTYSSPTTYPNNTTQIQYRGPQGLTGFNPTGDSGQNYIGSDGVGALSPDGTPTNLTYAQLDAINNPTQGELASTGGSFGNTFSNVAQGAQALAGLGQAYIGYKNYGLAKDMFNFQKATTNRNIANQASEYNTGVQNAGDVGMSLAGATMSPEQRAAYQSTLDSRKISTAPIG